jgi:hypothetical protein
MASIGLLNKGFRYLLHKQSDRFLDLAAAHIEAATICATYLSFSTLDLVFETGPGDVDTTKYEIHQGTFVFLDYATLSWIYHITMIGMHSKTTDACLPADLVASIERLLQKRGQSQFRRTASAKVLLPRFRIFKDNAALQSSLCSAAYFWGRAEHGLLDENRNYPCRFGYSTCCTLLTSNRGPRSHGNHRSHESSRRSQDLPSKFRDHDLPGLRAHFRMPL